MKITNFTVGRTLSDGDYGSKKLEVSVELMEGEKAFDEIQIAQMTVEKMVRGEFPKEEASVVPEAEPKPAGRKKKEELVEATKEAKPKAKAAKKVAKKTVKKVKNTSVPYNRDIANHKGFFSKVMDVIDPKWKAQGKKAAVATSKKMEGEDMFVSKTDDTVLESFKEDAEKWYLKTFKEMNTHV